MLNLVAHVTQKLVQKRSHYLMGKNIKCVYAPLSFFLRNEIHLTFIYVYLANSSTSLRASTHVLLMVAQLQLWETLLSWLRQFARTSRPIPRFFHL